MVSLRHVHGDILDAEVRGHVRKVPFVTETNRPTWNPIIRESETPQTHKFAFSN